MLVLIIVFYIKPIHWRIKDRQLNVIHIYIMFASDVMAAGKLKGRTEANQNAWTMVAIN